MRRVDLNDPDTVAEILLHLRPGETWEDVEQAHQEAEEQRANSAISQREWA